MHFVKGLSQLQKYDPNTYKRLVPLIHANKFVALKILPFFFFFFFFLRKCKFDHLNYTLKYILHYKLSECKISTLNYNPRHTLYHVVNSTVILDGKLKFSMQSVVAV